jgi:beta-xylosidase
MNKNYLLKSVLLSSVFIIVSASALGQTDTRWGDLGDGTYANPVLLADYSDPDVIRVGKKYYMTCSEFHFMGMPVLESDDMVNWRIIGQIFSRIDLEQFDTMSGYGDGTWAPSLRYHDGKFWMYVCMPYSGLYMSTATKPEGPWTPLYHVKDVQGWEDPCPFWDEDGQAYLGHSVLGAGPIILHRMSPDGRQLLDDGQKIYEGPVAEGTKFLKRNGYYYLSIPEGGVSTGWQMVLRSKNIYGPYDGKCCLETGSTSVNGPHQGALVDTPEGQWWFYHFQSHSPQGRVLHLQPVEWQEDGFPLIGKDYDGNGVGEPVKVWTKPATGKHQKPFSPQASDKFKGKKLSPQWAWNHNPVDSCWSLKQRKGWLALKAMEADELRKARNCLTQKIIGYTGVASVKLDYSAMTPSQRAGMACMGNVRYAVGVEVTADGTKHLYVERDGKTTLLDVISDKGKGILLLKLTIDDVKNAHHFSYSLNGKDFTPLGEEFPEQDADWKGCRIGLFTYAIEHQGGTAYFTDFDYCFDGPLLTTSP